MAQKTFEVTYKGMNTVNYDTDNQPAHFWSMFEKMVLPPFVKFVPYIVNPDITAMNPSSQWYGINNLVYQDQRLNDNDTNLYEQAPLPYPILEKDDMFYMTETSMYDVYENNIITFKECLPALQGFGTTTEGNAVTCLAKTYETNVPLYFAIDGTPSALPFIVVIPDNLKLEAGMTFYATISAEAVLDSFSSCKITGVEVGDDAGMYCTNTSQDAVNGYTLVSGATTMIAVRLRDIGKLKWTQVIGE